MHSKQQLSSNTRGLCVCVCVCVSFVCVCVCVCECQVVKIHPRPLSVDHLVQRSSCWQLSEAEALLTTSSCHNKYFFTGQQSVCVCGGGGGGGGCFYHACECVNIPLTAVVCVCVSSFWILNTCLSFSFPRYNLFIVLYPLGVAGELLTIYAALPFVRRSGMYSMRLPNKYNVSFWLLLLPHHRHAVLHPT